MAPVENMSLGQEQAFAPIVGGLVVITTCLHKTLRRKTLVLIHRTTIRLDDIQVDMFALPSRKDPAKVSCSKFLKKDNTMVCDKCGWFFMDHHRKKNS